jgi:hypothetical protein
MTSKPVTKILDYTIDSCPRCKKNHNYVLKVIAAASEDKVIMFGGDSVDKNEKKSEIFLECPDTKEGFTWVISNPSNGEIAGVATPKDITDAASTYASTRESSPIETEFADWVKNSRSRATDFCKTMISLSTGAVAVYFAVQQYLGFEKISDSTIGKMGILPPILFLISTIFFVLGLRPRFDLIGRAEFFDWRGRILTRMNQFIMAGTSIFLGAIGFAILIFFFTLSK